MITIQGLLGGWMGWSLESFMFSNLCAITNLIQHKFLSLMFLAHISEYLHIYLSTFHKWGQTQGFNPISQGVKGGPWSHEGEGEMRKAANQVIPVFGHSQ